MWIKEAERKTIAPPKYRSLFFPQPPRRSHQRPSPPLTRLPGRLCSHSDGEKVDKAAAARCILPAFRGPSCRVGSDRLYWKEERAPLLGNKQRVLRRLAPAPWLLWIPPRCGSQTRAFLPRGTSSKGAFEPEAKTQAERPLLSGL